MWILFTRDWLNVKAFETIVASLREQRLHISRSMPCQSVLSDTTVTVKRCSVVLSPCTNALTHRATAPHNHYQSRTYLPGEPGSLPFFASHRTRSVPPSVVANAGRNLRAHIPSCSSPPLPPLPARSTPSRRPTKRVLRTVATLDTY
jgi:hypothetical protein